MIKKLSKSGDYIVYTITDVNDELMSISRDVARFYIPRKIKGSSITIVARYDSDLLIANKDVTISPDEINLFIERNIDIIDRSYEKRRKYFQNRSFPMLTSSGIHCGYSYY